METLVAEDRNAFGEWLERKLIEKEISQVDLASRVKMSREQIRRLLNGESGSRKETIKAIAIAIGERPNIALRVWYDFEPEPEDEYDINDVPQDMQIAFGFQAKVAHVLPPGKARDQYAASLRAQAEANWALIGTRWKTEEEEEDTKE